MTPSTDELHEEYIRNILARIRPVPTRDPRRAALSKEQFLTQAASFRSAVSIPPQRRHNGWINTFLIWLRRKENRMVNSVIALLLALTILFGGTGATVYAAQGSLPDEPLYAVKTWSEDTSMQMTSDLQNQLNLALTFTNRRMTEIARLRAAGTAIPEAVELRLREQLEQQLQIAAGMDDAQMAQALEQIRLQSELQLQTMTELMQGDGGQGDQVMARLQDRLQEQIHLAELGESDPQNLRLRLQERDRDQESRPSITPNGSGAGQGPNQPGATPVPGGNGNGSGGPQDTEEPGHNGTGPCNCTQTPSPTGGSYGPGPGGDQATANPGGYGPGPGPINPSATPMPGGGNGGPGGGQATSTQGSGNNPGNGGSQNPSQTPGSGGGNRP